MAGRASSDRSAARAFAHARRRDCLARLAAHTICALYWFNPVAWLALRWLHCEGERACDDLVLAAGSRPAAYARHILHIASASAPSGLSAHAAIAMARKSNLEGRLLAILDATRNRRALTRFGACLTALLLIGLVVPISVMKATAADKNIGAAREDSDGVERSPAIQVGKTQKFVCSGKATGPGGEPIVSARVSVLRHKGGAHDPEYVPVAPVIQTGVDGAFRFSITRPSSSFRRDLLVVATKPGLALDWGHWPIQRERDVQIALRLRAPSKLGGVIVDQSDRPVAGATVSAYVTDKRGKEKDRVTLLGAPGLAALVVSSDSQGRFEFRNIPPDTRSGFLIRASGYAKVFTCRRREYGPRWGYWTAGETKIRIALPKEARIEGLAVDKGTGKGIPGVRLLARVPKRQQGFEDVACISGKDGRFRLDSLVSDKCVVKVLRPETGLSHWVAEQVRVRTMAGQPEAGVTVEVTRGGLLEVAVQDKANKQPIRGAHVWLYRRGRRLESFGPTDENGLVRIRLLPGDHRIASAQKPGYFRRSWIDKRIAVREKSMQKVILELRKPPRTRSHAPAHMRPIASAGFNAKPTTIRLPKTSTGIRLKKYASSRKPVGE